MTELNNINSILSGILNSITALNTDRELKYADKAIDFVAENPIMIEPRPVHIEVNLLWQWSDGKYYSKFPEETI